MRSSSMWKTFSVAQKKGRHQPSLKPTVEDIVLHRRVACTHIEVGPSEENIMCCLEEGQALTSRSA